MIQLEIPATMESLSRVRWFAQACAHVAGLADSRADLLTLAAVEVVSNVVRHARGLRRDAQIELTGKMDGQGLLLAFRYTADRYAPIDTSNPLLSPDMTHHAIERMPEGGFGLGIIQQAADTLNYRHEDGVNTVQIRVRI